MKCKHEYRLVKDHNLCDAMVNVGITKTYLKFYCIFCLRLREIFEEYKDNEN